MTYSFLDISTVKFSVNARELFKTFIPVLIDSTHIRIQNIYDSTSVLVPATHVSEFEVDGLTYANATDLSNAIHDVIFSRTVDGAVNNAQIETNRLAIIDLQNDKSDVNHHHDARYYTQAEVDAMITSIVSASDLLAKGEVDGDNVNFRKADDTIVFSIDAKDFTSQGTVVSFANGVLTLKNDKGATLSTTNIQAKESYYDTFKFVSGYEDDLSDLILEQAFQLVKTTGGLYFFVSDILNNEALVGSRIYINAVSLFFNFAEPDIETISFKAWQLTIPSESFIVNNPYVFNFWLKDYSILESQLSVVAKTGEYSDLIGAPNYTKESKSFLGGETQWVLTQVPSADFPHRVYSGSVDGGGLILLEENIDYTLVGNLITYLSPVLPIENHEKHIIHYNLPGDSSIYISPNNDVKLRNADVYEPVNTSAYYKNGIIFNSRNLQLMIATDLHGDVNAVNNIITMMNEFATIDGGLNLGDTCENTWEDDFSFVDPLMTIGKPFLIAIGNHDEGLGYTVANTGSTAAAYARFVQPYEATIGGTHAGKSYYYKDWVGYKIRTIVLYEYDDNDDLNVGDPLLYRVVKTTRVWSQAQIDWLIATLNSTPSDYSVMIAMHQTVVDQLTWIEGKFTDINHIVPGDSSSFSDEALIPDIINAWKNGASLVNTYPFTGEAAYKADISVNANFTARGPGEFICYLAGHAHVDAIGTVPAYADQLQIILTCSTSDANRNKYGDLQRQVGRRSEDCFNVISFDTFNKTVKIVRIGSQITFDMRKRDYIEIPY